MKKPAKQIKPPSPIRIEGDTAYIFLKDGFEAMIDVADIPLVQHKRWRLVSTKKGHGYVASGQTASGDFTTLHRFLLQPPRTLNVDHEDGDGLNNRRANIRTATGSQNNANSVVSRRNKLGVKGVSARHNKFRADIRSGDKHTYLGDYATIEEAAAAYKGAAKVLWGEFAKK